jgi:hypothetical protein
MNCFNIRELQGILKRKFFTDLVNTHEHRNLMDKTMIGLRYKSNTNLNLDNDMLTFYNFGINSQSNSQQTTLTSLTSSSYTTRPASGHYNQSIVNFFLNNDFISGGFASKFFSVIFSDVFALFTYMNLYSFSNAFKPQTFFQSILNNFNFLNFSISEFSFKTFTTSTTEESYIFFVKKDTGLSFNSDEFKRTFSESSNSQRFTRFSTSLINYDYKTGHYIGN